MPDRVESLREVDGRENRPKARFGFVISIRNGLRKIKNLIEIRPSRRGERMELRLQKDEYTR